MLGKKAFYNHFRSMGYTVCQTANRLIKKINNDLVLEIYPNDDGNESMVILTFNESYIRYFDSKSRSVTDFETKAITVYNAVKGIIE